MKEPLNEQISGLADGELSPDEMRFALRRLGNDADARQAWSRIHLARACLKREVALPASAGFAHAVMARLEEGERVPRTAPVWLRTAAGGLIAAGVAAVALFAATPRDTVAPTAPAAGGPALVAATPIRTEDLRPPIGALPASDSILAPVRASSAMLADPRLDQYLIQHSDATLSGPRGGYVPYIYIVSSPPRSGPVPPNRAEPDGR